MPALTNRPRRSQLGVLLGALAISTCLGGRAAADFEVDNLGPNQGFNTQSGYNLTGPQVFTGQGYAIAVEFAVSSPTSVAFDSAQLGLTYRSGTNALDVSLMTDAGGVPSGTSLETIQVMGIPADPELVTVTSTAHSILTAGLSYWLVASYGAPDTNIGWFMNDTNQLGHAAYRPDTASGLGSWMSAGTDADPSFAIRGSFVRSTIAVAVPTPSSRTLLGIGCLGLIGTGRLTRLKRRQTR